MTKVNFAQPDQAHWGGDRTVPRDRYGRPLITPPDGGEPEAYTRCTTFVDALSDKTTLTVWKQRMTALGLAKRDDLLLQIAQHDPDDKRGIDRLINEAVDAAGGSRAADIGTQLHEATEKHDRGEPVGPLGKWQADLDAYIEATKNITWLGVETFRVHDSLKIAGTADRIANINGRSVIADVKTGGLYEPGKFAMQLAVYAHSVPYDPGTGIRDQDIPPVDLDTGLLIHLPEGQGRCDLYWLNLSAGWEAAQIAARVREWRQFQSRKATKGQVMQPVQDEAHLRA